jgi:hypothetical protein
MISFFRYLQYRGEVWVNIMSFLIMYPGGKRVISAAYPNINSAIRSGFNDDISPSRAAAVISAAVLADLASKLSPSERFKVLNELRNLDSKGFQTFLGEEAGRRSSGARPATLFPGATLATTIFAGSLHVADLWKRQGAIEHADASFIQSEVIDTLEGLSEAERKQRRLRVVGSFENLSRSR